MVTLLEKTDAIQYVLDNDDSFMLHIVNCQGVMGSGIADQVRQRVPRAYKSYMDAYETDKLQLGCVTGRDGVLNLAAQDKYGRDRRHLNYGALSECLVCVGQAFGFDAPIVIPYMMGCDRAGGDWEVVLEMVTYYFDDVTICALGSLK